MLIAGAASIVVDNSKTKPVVAHEIKEIESLGRVDDTYFTNVEEAARILKLAPGRFRPLDGQAMDHMHNCHPRKTDRLIHPPNLTCRWLDKAARSDIESTTMAVQQWLTHLPQPSSMALVDLKLDACWYLVANYSALEDVPGMARNLNTLART